MLILASLLSGKGSAKGMCGLIRNEQMGDEMRPQSVKRI